MKCHFCGVELNEVIFLVEDKCLVCNMPTRMILAEIIVDLKKRIEKLENKGVSTGH